MKIVRPIEVTDAILVSSTVAEDDAPAYSATVAYAVGDTVMVAAEHKVYESLTASLRGTATLTIATPCVVTWPGGTAPAADTPCSFTTTGALPTGLAVDTLYYVKSPSGGTSNLSLTPGGAAINTSGSQSGTHTVTASQNAGKTPADNSDPEAVTQHWLDLGATNLWRLFDEVVGQQCEDAGSIEVVLEPASRCNTLALFNLDASEVQIVVTSPTEGVVYDETHSLVSDSGINSWYAWFFEPIVRKTSLVVPDLPAHSGVEVTVTITGDGTVKCGELVLGLSREIGSAMWGIEVGIRDYSYKEQDDFGNWRITPRAFSRRNFVPVWVDGGFTDELVRLLENYRSTPVVWIGLEHVASTHVYGFYKDFSVVLESPPKTLCTLELEGLT